MKPFPIVIGIDGNEANVPNRVGVGRYAYELLKHLYQICIDSKESYKSVFFRVYLKNNPRADLPRQQEFWQYKVVGPKPAWTQLGLPINLFLDRGLTVFFTPGHYAPRFSPFPQVIAIMDISYLYYPQLFKKSDLYQLRHWTAYSVKKARKILTISQNSKKDIVKEYGVNPDDVIVTYPGYDRELFYFSDSQAVQAQIMRAKKLYRIDGEYVLYTGTLQPRKNIASLLSAFSQLRSRMSYKSMVAKKSLKLVIAGKKGWLYDDIFEKVNTLNLENDVIFTDFVPDDILASLYRGATCLVLPSFYEGFGLPVVEAMACGVPVVVSNISSLPEIVGDVGVLIYPTDSTSLAEAIAGVVGWEREKRMNVVKKGVELVKKFSWENCAKKTLETLIAVGEENAQG